MNLKFVFNYEHQLATNGYLVLLDSLLENQGPGILEDWYIQQSRIRNLSEDTKGKMERFQREGCVRTHADFCIPTLVRPTALECYHTVLSPLSKTDMAPSCLCDKVWPLSPSLPNSPQLIFLFNSKHTPPYFHYSEFFFIITILTFPLNYMENTFCLAHFYVIFNTHFCLPFFLSGEITYAPFLSWSKIYSLSSLADPEPLQAHLSESWNLSYFS